MFKASLSGRLRPLRRVLLSTLWAWPSSSVLANILPSSGQQEQWTPPMHLLVPTLLLAVVLCGVLAWLRSKRADSRKPAWLAWLSQMPVDGSLRVKDMKRLTPRTSLHVVEWEGGSLLVAVSDHFCVRLDAQAVPAEPCRTGEQG